MKSSLLKGKDAKLYLINAWAKGEKIVTAQMLQLAIDCKNPPEVIELLGVLQGQIKPPSGLREKYCFRPIPHDT